ncbi:hypothetical protein NCCP28_31510 [Niallia sp. NCCP-28]|nr:hypothetical protein NCCP28_31510 [Niallia sp. NCCP-28]
MDIQACEKSLYKVLETQFSIKIKKTIEQLELTVADALNISKGKPCFNLETFAYDDKNSSIEYSKTIFRGERAHFVIERNY